MELHALTQVACSYVLLTRVVEISTITITYATIHNGTTIIPLLHDNTCDSEWSYVCWG